MASARSARGTRTPHPLGSEIVWSARFFADEAVAAQVEEIFGEGAYGGGLAALRGRFTE